MIQIDSITIREFRGIRKLELNFKGKNFAVCGPNGTGKSGVVDALEFALTGSVSRLTGEGSGDVSVLEHGPHVDFRSAPEKAIVTVTATIPALKKTVEIERNVKQPSKPKISPSTPDILAALAEIAAHPEIVLSRRQIIRYVLATPGKRAQEVQALLRLDEVEKTRAGLQKIANACAKEHKPYDDLIRASQEEFLKAVGLTDARKGALLDAANERRRILGLPDLTDLTDTTALNDGLATAAPGQALRISKVQATADLESLSNHLTALESARVSPEFAECQAEIASILADPIAATSAARDRFYAAGAELIDDGACPFCDDEWDMQELVQHIVQKRAHIAEITKRLVKVNAVTADVAEKLRDVVGGLQTLGRHAVACQPAIPVEAVRVHIAALVQVGRQLTGSVSLREVGEQLASIASCPPEVRTVIEQLAAHVTALPDPSKETAAREWLNRAQEKLDAYRKLRRQERLAKSKAQSSKTIADTFSATSDRVLTDLYKAVQDDFVKLYSFVNRDDEAEFKASLTPSLGKLGFDVDFYGRGYFPPGAYHSEGHQDGMGLCLYLALMRHVLGEAFRFAVLDDVLMSVDSAHRREVCSLLKQEFPETQFIMTTHDPIWLRHMRTEALTDSKSQIQFRNWTVGEGPTQWDDRDVWAEIGDSLKRNDVRAAAGVLRNYLEYMGGELCHRLRAPVEFRGDAQYMLGDLMPPAIGQMRKLFGKAKVAAQSWGQKERVAEIGVLEGSFVAAATASNAEQWQVNTAIHYNEWANLSKKDFEPVVASFKALVEAFGCTTCGEKLKVSPERGKSDALRCGCTAVNLNLKERSA